jgi:hypothetical protein
MSLPFLRTLQGDRFFQLLILVGVGLSFFSNNGLLPNCMVTLLETNTGVS